MTRKKLLVGGLVGAALVLGIAGFWTYSRNARQNRPELVAKAAAVEGESVSVQVKAAERSDLFRQVELPGSIEALEQVTLYAKTAGYLKWIKVDIGDRVRKGQVLAEIDVPEMAPEYQGAEAEVERSKANLANARAEAERAKAELELKRITYDRLKSVREQEPDVLPQQQVDEAKAQFDVARAMVNVAESKIKVAQGDAAKAEASRARLAALMEYAKIQAPFDGVVTVRSADPGALIQHAASQTNVSSVVTVARVDTLRLFVDVTETDVPFVKIGIPVTLTVDAVPGRVYRGRCTRFATSLDPKTRTMRTEIDIPNRDGSLRPGMFGRVKLDLERRENALTVPAGALVTESGKVYLWIVAGGKAKRIEVQTGMDDGIRVEITSGLTGNEEIIMGDKTRLKEGASVKAAIVS